MIRRPARATLCPYATLFRSRRNRWCRVRIAGPVDVPPRERPKFLGTRTDQERQHHVGVQRRFLRRSDAHTSELQSRQYLVCRLLLAIKPILQLPSSPFTTSL